MNHKGGYILAIALLILSLNAYSQNSKLMDQGDLLVSRYEFKLAASVYKEAMQKADSATTATIQEKLLQCENGQNMLQYGTRPQLVTKKSLAKDEFFLYYTHLGANSWKVTEGGEIVFFPSGSDKLVITKEDESGQLGLYTADKISGNNWGPLTPLNETLAAGVDAVLPIFSADGKTIYFTAKGLFGMGGYDVYSCKWDESAKEWGAPENIGFPFSSPADDFLFSPTEDGSMALFASNRESASPDSLIVYVVKYDSTPVKSAVSSAEEAAGIAIFNSDALSGNKAQSGKTEQNSAEKEAVQAYAKLKNEYRSIENEIVALQKREQELRGMYDRLANVEDKKALEKSIFELETQLMEKQYSLNAASSKMQSVETEFLAKGIEVYQEEDTDHQNALASAYNYSFVKGSLSSFPTNLVFAEPEKKVDYTFKVLDEAMIVEDNSLPQGLVYQIQFLTVSKKASLKTLKGLSPVFEAKKSASKYVYSVGLFRTYNEANSALSTVKKRGFSSAFIVAYNNGTTMTVSNARALEKKQQGNQKYRIVFSEYPDGIPAAIITLIQSTCSKDIAKGVGENGAIRYFIAPFDSLSEAEKVQSALITGGAEGVTIEEIK